MSDIILPGGRVHETSKERREQAAREAHMRAMVSRGELHGTINEALTNLLTYLLTHFELAPKTDEGRQLLATVQDTAAKIQEAMAAADVSQVTTEEARAEAKARAERLAVVETSARA